MKVKYTKILSAILAIVIVLTVAVPSLAAGTTQPKYCGTSEELSDYMLSQLGNRVENISVTIPNTLSEADFTNTGIFRQVLRKDNGSIRWGYKGGTVQIEKHSGYTTYNYIVQYYSTKDQDDAARKYADEVVAKLGCEGLSDVQKVQKLREFVTTNWRYDKTLKNMTAHSTMKNKSGTCLGLVLASQLMLESMGIQTQTVHGKYSGSNAYHIILLVKLNGWWYTFDPSELAREKPIFTSHLRAEYINRFTPEAEYLTDSFRKTYPMITLQTSIANK